VAILIPITKRLNRAAGFVNMTKKPPGPLTHAL
jgi:hypothetical protein